MRAAVAAWLDRHADPAWHDVHRLHTMWVTAFWAALAGLWAAWPAFQEYMTPPIFGLTCVGLSVILAIARFTKQPGLM